MRVCSFACRRRASEHPKATAKDAEARDDAAFDLTGENSGPGHQSSLTSQEILRPVASSDREALEAELEVLRRQLSSTAVGAG